MGGDTEAVMITEDTTAEMRAQIHQSLRNLREDVTTFYHTVIDELDNIHGALLDIDRDGKQ